MTDGKTFSLLVLSAFVSGVGLVAAGVMLESEFLGALGAFPLLLAMFLLPHALLEWKVLQGDSSSDSLEAR